MQKYIINETFIPQRNPSKDFLIWNTNVFADSNIRVTQATGSKISIHIFREFLDYASFQKIHKSQRRECFYLVGIFVIF